MKIRLGKLWRSTNRDKVPRSFTRTLKEPFETAYMKELFQIGYDHAPNGYPWVKRPPGFVVAEGEASQ